MMFKKFKLPPISQWDFPLFWNGAFALSFTWCGRLCFEVIVCSQILQQVFQITGPCSRILQSTSADMAVVAQMISQCTQSETKTDQRSWTFMQFLITETQRFATVHDSFIHITKVVTNAACLQTLRCLLAVHNQTVWPMNVVHLIVNLFIIY